MQILIYCRSSVSPYHRWRATRKLFTLDVIYLHDKPESKNCPQKVCDALVDILEQVSKYEGYIFESEHGLPRILFRNMCVLLSHPQQRCIQDDINIPKHLRKNSAAVDTTACGETVPVSGQELSMLNVNILAHTSQPLRYDICTLWLCYKSELCFVWMYEPYNGFFLNIFRGYRDRAGPSS